MKPSGFGLPFVGFKKILTIKETSCTGQDEQTDVDFISILVPATGERAQSKSEYPVLPTQRAGEF